MVDVNAPSEGWLQLCSLKVLSVVESSDAKTQLNAVIYSTLFVQK